MKSFRQLLKESINHSLYHITPTENIDKILRQGLIPNVGERSKQMDDEPGIFLFPSLLVAEDAMNWFLDEFDEDIMLTVLEIDPDGLDIHPSSVEYELICKSKIPPENIKVLGNIDEVFQ